MFMQGFAPRPKPIVSRFTPTIPVRAPPNGSRAEGELWVSTLWVTMYWSSKTIAPELSEKTETQMSLSPAASRISFVAAWMYVL